MSKKLNNNIFKKIFAWAALVVALGGSFLLPIGNKSAAAGNSFNFSDISLTTEIQVSDSPNGPWENKNFIRTTKDKPIYVKTVIRLAGAVNNKQQKVEGLTFSSDQIDIPYGTDLTIKGAGPSFVAKVTNQQAIEIAKKVAAGETNVAGIPCYTESITSTGGAIGNVVIIGGAAALGATFGAAAIGSAALSLGGTSVGTAIGADTAAIIIADSSVTAGVAATGAGMAGIRLLPFSGDKYIKCDGPVRPTMQGNGVVKVGDVLYSDTVTVPASSFPNLGMSLSASKDSSAVNEFYVLPNLYFDTWWGIRNDFMTAVKSSGPGGSGKSVYVQIYDKDTELAQHINDPVPSGVPNNGVNTGSGEGVGSAPSALINFINDVIGTIVGWIQSVIYFIFVWFVSPLIVAILSIRTYTDSFAAVIYPGWEIVRNLCNILFIISLIAIALGTLFRLESYQYKHMLVQLIIAALLVNFSLVMAQIVLGFADTVQNSLLPNNQEVINALAKMLMVDTKIAFNQLTSAGQAGYFALTIKPFFHLSLAVGSFLVFCAIGAFLLVRVVALWVLLMISPIAYAAGALPTTAHYRSEWWSNFIKYAFFTPIMAFFLNIIASIGAAQKSNPILQQAASGSSSIGGNPTISNFMVVIGSNLILLLMLMIAIKVASQFGIMGADVAQKWVKGGMLAPFGAFKAFQLGGGYIARRWNEMTANRIRGHGREVSMTRAALFAVANPVAVWKGMKKHHEEVVHAAQAKAEAAGLEAVEQRLVNPKAFLLGKKKVLTHVLNVEKQHEDEFAKQFTRMSRENVARTAAELSTLGFSDEDLATKRGIIKVALSKGYIDDIIQEAWKTKDGRDMVQKMYDDDLIKDSDFKGGKMWGTDKDGNKIMNQLNYNNRTRRGLYYHMFGKDNHGNLKDHAAARLITEEGETEGMATGHLEYMTDMYFNHESGHYEFYGIDYDKDWETKDGMKVRAGESVGEALMAGSEIAKRDSRTQAKIAWHSLMDDDGNYFSKAIFAKIAKAASENPTFMQERTANKLIAGTTDEQTLKDIREHYRKTGELLLDEKSINRINDMMTVDEKATVAIISRFLNDAEKPAIEKRMKTGVIVMRNKNKPLSGGGYADADRKFTAEIIEQTASERALKTFSKADAEVKVHPNSTVVASKVLGRFDTPKVDSSTGMTDYSNVKIPDFNTVVNDIINEGVSSSDPSKHIIVKRSDAQKIAAEFVTQLTQKVMSDKGVDALEVAQTTPATNYSRVELEVPSPERFGDVINAAVLEGVTKGTRFTTDSEKIQAIKLSIDRSLKDKDIQKKLGNIDLTTASSSGAPAFDSGALAAEIYKKLK